MDNLLKEYLTIEYLHKRAMHFYGLCILHIHLLLGQFILYCNYTLLRYRAELDSVVLVFIGCIAFSSLTYWIFTLEASGLLTSHATQVLKSWKFMKHKNPLNAKLMRKFIKRSRPLSIYARDFFTIRRLSVLKFIMAIVKGTFRALLLTLTNKK